MMLRAFVRLYPGDRRLLAAALALLAVGWVLGLAWAPPDRLQGDAQRLMYVHVPAAWNALGLLTLAAAASAWHLWRRTALSDRLARAAIETGLLFGMLALVLGMVWGRPVWGVWWTWDPRLTTTAILLLVFAGVLGLRRAIEDPARRGVVSAAATLVSFVDVPIVHQSVVWWESLHQDATVLRLGEPTIAGSMLTVLLVNALAMGLLAAWILMRRIRLARLETTVDDRALRERLARARPLSPPSPARLREGRTHV
jgi:heme exporter protein C